MPWNFINYLLGLQPSGNYFLSDDDSRLGGSSLLSVFITTIMENDTVQHGSVIVHSLFLNRLTLRYDDV